MPYYSLCIDQDDILMWIETRNRVKYIELRFTHSLESRSIWLESHLRHIQSHSRRKWIPKRTLFFRSARPRADAQCVKYTCMVSALSAQFLYWTWASARRSVTMSDSHIAHLFYQMNQAHLDVWTTWNCTKLKTAAISSHVSSWNPYFVRLYCILILTKHISNYNIVNK